MEHQSTNYIFSGNENIQKFVEHFNKFDFDFKISKYPESQDLYFRLTLISLKEDIFEYKGEISFINWGGRSGFRKKVLQKYEFHDQVCSQFNINFKEF